MTQHNEFKQLESHLNQRIVYQHSMVRQLLVALLADGHLLVEGVPGLAKTRAVKELAACIQGDFQRIQFTPDLLPSDLVGTEIYRPQEGSFQFRAGPLFHNIILADEINRSPAKVQSALLEAMGERQITVGNLTRPLPPLFLVMATQNPIEQEGTYPLPEAQLDRFLLHVRVDYPHAKAEAEILKLARADAMASTPTAPPPLSISQAVIFAARQQVLSLHLSPDLEEYLIRLVLATRNPRPYGEDLVSWVRFGASPRATIAIDRCARAHAWLSGRDYVSPDDIHAVAYNVLRHRVLLSFEAEAEGATTDGFIAQLLGRIAVP